MSNGAYKAFAAITSAPFGKTLRLIQAGTVVDMTGWTGFMTLSATPGGSPLLTVAMATDAAGSSLSIQEGSFTNFFGVAYTAGFLVVEIAEADLQALPVAPLSGVPGDPTTFYYELILTDTTGFARRYLYGAFNVGWAALDSCSGMTVVDCDTLAGFGELGQCGVILELNDYTDAAAIAAATQAQAAAVAAQLGGAGSLVLPAARASLFAAMQADGLFSGFIAP